MEEKQVVVYSMDDCIECEFVKRMLTEENILFQVRDVRANKRYQKEVKQLGFMGVPVTVWKNHAVKGLTAELQEMVEQIKKQAQTD